MIPEIGHFAVIVAFLLGLTQAVIPLIGTYRNHVGMMQLARRTAIGQFIFVGVAFAALAYAFLSNDFSVAYVAQNSNTKLPGFYKFCALWGAHEGSLLLWVFILSIWMAAVSLFSRSLPLEMLARVLAVLGMIAVGFYLFLLMTSDPFTRLLPNVPLNGRDLNPLLQDPGLVIHPPMLYMGYVGFSVAFAFAIAALISGKLDAVWAKWSRPWTIVAWCFLTFGIVLGSWWAYRELGWGGWWFWDPVENASFLPWLVGTALIHSLAVTEKRNAFKAWTVLLAVSAFSLSLLGTFLVRSGVLISVHAFAVDPQRGVFMLRFLLIVVGGSLGLYAWRGRKIVTQGHFHFFSRETMLLTNNVILFVAMITVLMGTLYPLMIDALGMGKLSVGAPYFNAVFGPLMVPLFLLMGVGPMFHWNKMDPHVLIKRLMWSALIVLLLALLLPRLEAAPFKWSVLLGLSLAFWIILNTVSLVFRFQKGTLPKLKRISSKQLAMMVAHIGMGVVIIGITLTTAYSQQRNLSMKPGDVVSVGPYQFQFVDVVALKGPNYSGATATFVVKRNKHFVALLRPQQRVFPVQQTSLAKTAIDVGITRDLYVALGSSLNDGGWGVRIYYKPFVRWIWGGGLLLIIGGAISLWDKRHSRQPKRAR